MVSGGPGDHPLTDLFHYGLHPFPADIEAMIVKLRDVSPRHLDQITATELYDWQHGRNLDHGRERLRSLLASYQADLDRLLKSEQGGKGRP